MGRREKQVDRRARELPGSYRRPLERLDRHMGHSRGRLADWWQGFRAMGPCSAMWLDSGVRAAQTYILLSRAVQRRGWRTW